MSTIIYWAVHENEWLRAKTPEPIYKDFVKNTNNDEMRIKSCPAIKNYMNNIFKIKSLYDYNFKVNEDQTFSEMYNQKFFDKHVVIRSQKHKMFSFQQSFCFFTEKKSLEMSAGLFPFLEENNITKNCITIPGTFNIGKWFRVLDFAFNLKTDCDEFKIEEDEIFQYIKFHTDDKIIFKQFKVTKEIESYLIDTDFSKSFRKFEFRSLDNYYSMINYKKNIIKEIKKNLIKGN
jgi:hypothetical protein